jgi:hypothetical protein
MDGDLNQLIDTPYGKKRWGYLKRVMDSHELLVAACRDVHEMLCVAGKGKESKTFRLILEALQKAEE